MTYQHASQAGKRHNDLAVRICRSCPVQLRCLELGRDTNSRGVIFGGRRYLEAVTRARRCDNCGADYMPVITFQKFCGERCGQAVRDRQYRARKARAR